MRSVKASLVLLLFGATWFASADSVRNTRSVPGTGWPSASYTQEDSSYVPEKVPRRENHRWWVSTSPNNNWVNQWLLKNFPSYVSGRNNWMTNWNWNNNWGSDNSGYNKYPDSYKTYPDYNYRGNSDYYPSDWKNQGPIDYSLIDREGRTKNQQVYPPVKKSICQQNEIYGLKKFAHYRPHNKCYEIGSTGPCKQNMKFYLEETGSEYGSCDCDANVGYSCGRPLVYWAKDDWCYPVTAQGPCKYSEWLVLDIKGQPTCEPNVCSQEQIMDNYKDTDCMHWVGVNGKCYETSSQGYCLQDEVLRWNVYDSRATEPQCVRLKSRDYENWVEPLDLNYSANWSSNQRFDRSLPCLPGQKQTMLRKCRPNSTARRL